MSIRKLLGQTAVYGIGDLLLFGISYLAIIPLLTRHLSPEEYGAWATLTSISVFLLAVFQLGLPSAVFRYYFVHKTTGDHESFLGSIWITSLILTFLMAGVFSVTGKSLWNLVIRDADFQTYAKYVIWGAFLRCCCRAGAPRTCVPIVNSSERHCVSTPCRPAWCSRRRGCSTRSPPQIRSCTHCSRTGPPPRSRCRIRCCATTCGAPFGCC